MTQITEELGEGEGILRESAHALLYEVDLEWGYPPTVGEDDDEQVEISLKHIRALAAALSLHTPPAPEREGELRAEQVEWVVNDLAELGVKIGEQFFFLYKGYSLVYQDARHEDDGKPMMWRPVFKREFGECALPINRDDPRMKGTVSLDDSDEWKILPLGAPPALADGEKGEALAQLVYEARAMALDYAADSVSRADWEAKQADYERLNDALNEANAQCDAALAERDLARVEEAYWKGEAKTVRSVALDAALAELEEAKRALDGAFLSTVSVGVLDPANRAGRVEVQYRGQDAIALMQRAYAALSALSSAKGVEG